MRRTLAVAVLALWALIGLPGTAHAGGPTSVLITEPATGNSTALYVTSGDYADLERLLEEGSKAPASDPPTGSGGADYNLTWMIHDVQPWRLDSLHVSADGTAFVATTFVSDPNDFGGDASYREVAQPKELAALLDRVFSGAPSKTGTQSAIDQEPAAAPTAPAAAEPATRWFSLTGWRWVVPGVLGGLLVGFAVTRRRVPGEPRRVLVDGSPVGEARNPSASTARS